MPYDPTIIMRMFAQPLSCRPNIQRDAFATCVILWRSLLHDKSQKLFGLAAKLYAQRVP